MPVILYLCKQTPAGRFDDHIKTPAGVCLLVRTYFYQLTSSARLVFVNLAFLISAGVHSITTQMASTR